MSRLTVVVASRKLVRIWTENQLFQLFFSSESKGKRDQDQNVVLSLRDRENLTRPSEERE